MHDDSRADSEPAIGAREFEEMVRREMPAGADFDFRIESWARGRARLRLRASDRQLRPGGTIAGPVLFTLADTALWAACLSIVGLETMAVTADLALTFLRRPAPVDLLADVEILGRQGDLLLGEVVLRSDGDERPVARAQGSYMLP